APIRRCEALHTRLRSGELDLVVEIPPGFGRDLARGQSPESAIWIDGGMPPRAETIQSYTQAIHRHILNTWIQEDYGAWPQNPVDIKIRFRYNPDLLSLVAMIPALIHMLLIFIPAMLTALAEVGDNVLGRILQLCTTPVT